MNKCLTRNHQGSVKLTYQLIQHYEEVAVLAITMLDQPHVQTMTMTIFLYSVILLDGFRTLNSILVNNSKKLFHDRVYFLVLFDKLHATNKGVVI